MLVQVSIFPVVKYLKLNIQKMKIMASDPITSWQINGETMETVTLLTKVHLVKSMVFPVVMYGCESWTIKKAECRRIDVFKLWCWEDFWESLGLQGDQLSQSQRKSVLHIHWKNWCWSWSSSTLTTWCIRPDRLEKTDPGKDWMQEKGTTEDKMVGWHHQLYGHEFE